VQLTDAIRALTGLGRVVGVEFTGQLLDVGTLDSWMATNAAMVWKDLELGPALRAIVRQMEAEEA
jgi:UTP-glucose-1-phosphate uridylyltransferase